MMWVNVNTTKQHNFQSTKHPTVPSPRRDNIDSRDPMFDVVRSWGILLCPDIAARVQPPSPA